MLDSSTEHSAPLTREDCVSRFRTDLSEYLQKLKHSCDEYGLLSEDTETFFDTGIPDMVLWEGAEDPSSSEDIDIYIEAIDSAIDGYIVRPRVSIKTVRNAWVLQPTGASICVTWVDDRGYTGIVYDTYILMEAPQDDIFWRAIYKYGVWPLKDDYLPTPRTSQLQDEILHGA